MAKQFTSSVTVLLAQVMLLSPAFAQGLATPATTSPEVLAQELRTVRAELRARPDDAPLQFKAGEVLRKLGRNGEAAEAYSRATELDPHMYVAYHQLAQACDDAQLLEEAIERLSKLAPEKPKELMLRVAWSELLEKRGKFHEAARPLIDLTYANAVPEKFKAKVSARIHYLLAQKKAQQQEDVRQTTAATEEELDVVPSPLPARASKRSIAAARIKDAREVKGVGKVPLLP